MSEGLEGDSVSTLGALARDIDAEESNEESSEDDQLEDKQNYKDDKESPDAESDKYVSLGDEQITKADFHDAMAPTFDYAFHSPPHSDMGSCLFEVASGQIADGEFSAEELLEVQTKMQLTLRKAFQYRILNAMEASRLRNLADAVTFLALVLSGVSSILLLTSYDEASIAIAATISAVVTALTGYQSYMEFESRYTSHASSVKDFSSVQRNILTSLTIKTEQNMAKDLVQLTAELAAAVQAMPGVSPEIIEGYKAKEGKNIAHTGNPDPSYSKDGRRSLFPQITSINRWNESMDAVDSMRNIGLFRPWPEIGEKVGCEAEGLRRRTSFRIPTKK